MLYGVYLIPVFDLNSQQPKPLNRGCFHALLRCVRSSGVAGITTPQVPHHHVRPIKPLGCSSHPGCMEPGLSHGAAHAGQLSGVTSYTSLTHSTIPLINSRGFFIPKGRRGMKVLDFSASLPSVASIKNAGYGGVMLYCAPGRETWMRGKQPPKSYIDQLNAAGIKTGFVWRSEERRVGKECRSRWSPYH